MPLRVQTIGGHYFTGQDVTGFVEFEREIR